MSTDNFEEKPISNSKKKKMNAQVHNTTNEILENILPIGKCTCEGTLFMYLKSEDQNILNIYCDKCDIIRKCSDDLPDDMFFITPVMQMEVLKKVYGDEKLSQLLAPSIKA